MERSLFYPLLWLGFRIWDHFHPVPPYTPDYIFPPPGWTADDDLILIHPSDSPRLARALHDLDGWTVSLIRNVSGAAVVVCTKART